MTTAPTNPGTPNPGEPTASNERTHPMSTEPEDRESERAWKDQLRVVAAGLFHPEMKIRHAEQIPTTPDQDPVRTFVRAVFPQRTEEN